MLEIVEHPSAGYKPRTLHNAQQADATIAFAVDFSTAGEKLTRKAAGDKYLAVPLGTDTLDAARSIFRFLRERHAGVLNIAGNGIYALSSHEWTQWACNAYIHFIISKVHEHRPIGQILTGGQTGVDLAGAVAGFQLGIPASVTLPNGFLQRDEDMKDRQHTAEDIRLQIVSGADALRLP